MVDPRGIFDEARVAKHLRYVQHHQGHRVINDRCEDHKDDHEEGEDDVDVDKSSTM